MSAFSPEEGKCCGFLRRIFRHRSTIERLGCALTFRRRQHGLAGVRCADATRRDATRRLDRATPRLRRRPPCDACFAVYRGLRHARTHEKKSRLPFFDFEIQE